MRAEDLLNYEPTLGMRCFVKISYGMKLDSEETDFLAQDHLYGPIAQAPPGGWNPEGYPESLLVCGSRSTKTTIAAAIAVYEASTRDWRRLGLIRAHEFAYVTVVAARQDQADELGKQHILTFLLGSPMLSQLVVERHMGGRGKKVEYNTTQKRALLTTGNAIVARPCTSRASRGYPIPTAILDEMMHWNRETSTQSVDMDVYRGLKPRMAQFGRWKRLMAISTPCGMLGMGYDWFNKRKDFSDFRFVLHAPTRLMNPSIPMEEIETAKREDPILYAQEWEADFVDATFSFIDPYAVDRAFDAQPFIPDPETKRFRIMAIDPAIKSDTFAIVIGSFDYESKQLFIEVCEGLEVRKESGVSRNMKQVPLRSDDLREEAFGKKRHELRNASQPICPDAAEAKVDILYNLWGCDEAWTDQNLSPLLLPRLKRFGLNFHGHHFGGQDRQKVYSLLKSMVETGRVRIAGKGTKWVERLRNEMKTIRGAQTPGGQFTITKGAGTDDFSDAAAHLVWRLWRRNRDYFTGSMEKFRAFAMQGPKAAEAVGVKDSLGSFQRSGTHAPIVSSQFSQMPELLPPLLPPWMN